MNKEKLSAKNQIIYIMKFEIQHDICIDMGGDKFHDIILEKDADGNSVGSTTIYKVGITSRKVQHRLSEVVMSMFNHWRYIPRTSVKRYRMSKGFRKIEKEMHQLLLSGSVMMDDKISGHTEFFYVNSEERLIEEYEKLLDKYADYEPEPEPVVDNVELLMQRAAKTLAFK
jgi:hypothetical protein